MSNNFLADYHSYVSPLEVPDIFHVWCGLSALAAAAQRKIWIDMGLFEVTPNLYICLVSPPGKCGKDTAMNFVRKFLGKVSTIKTQSDSITKEKIYQSMADSVQFAKTANKTSPFMHCSLTIFASELSLLIKKGDKDFVAALCTLYNILPVFKNSTKTQGEDIIVNPYLNWLAGTTPDWLSVNIQEDVMEGGLSARTFFVHADTIKQLNANPRITPEGEAAYPRIIARLERITQLAGPCTRTKEAIELYEEWYYKHHKEEPANPKMSGYHWRKRTHLAKLAILLSVAERDDLVITETHFLQGLQILKEVEPCIEKALSGVGRNILSQEAQRILRQMRDARKMSLKDLLIQNYHQLNNLQLTEVLNVLVNMKAITMSIEGGEIMYTYVGREQ